MSTITKQWLQQKIAEMEATRDEIPFGLDEDDSNTLAALRIALASLVAEPIAWLWSNRKHPSEVTLVRPEDDDKAEAAQWSGWSYKALYAEPQVRVAPEDLLHMAASAIEDLLSNIDRSCAGVWADIPAKLRRAAMLRSFGNSEQLNSPVIPDGWVACSERMPEDEQEVITHNIFGYRHVSFFDEHSGNFFDRLDGSPVDCGEHVLVSHWMPLPAAPQQEVKP
ncbi:DUF551 domain-containing protein [Enterobacter hormaechei]|uniref:DUF551 domain-containing protein n=1 Tax=Enterobacter hormaechei TaxID=158836 RepID=UPI001F383B0D|nr:DUF551 domain-containing protein [Enterobacter hormaechei]